MTDQQPRPKVQRGISTVSQTPSRIGLKRGTSEAAQRAAVQRALSTISSKSGGKDKDTSDGLLSELQWQPSTEKTKPSLLKRILHAAGHASLILMLAVYTAAGGAAFVYFEGDNEKDIVEKHNQNVLQAKSSAKELMWSYVINEYTTNITAYEIGFKNELHNVLTTYDNRLYDAALNKVDVRKTKPDYQWHYKNSMFFSATVITTIGE